MRPKRDKREQERESPGEKADKAVEGSTGADKPVEGSTQAEKPGRRKGRIGRILSWLLCLLLIPVIILNFSLIIRNYTDPDRIPGVLGYMPMIVLSGSMSPAFEAGSVVLIRAVDNPAAMEEGDVICYLLDGKAITHRIIDVERDGAGVRYVVQGDANNVEDRLAVNPGQIQGEYTGIHIEGLGDICMFMQSTTGMILFVICPLVCLLLWDFVARKIKGRKEKSRSEELEEELRALKAQQAMLLSGEAASGRQDQVAPVKPAPVEPSLEKPASVEPPFVKPLPVEPMPEPPTEAPKTLLDFITQEQYQRMSQLMSEDALFMLEQLISDGQLETAERLILSKMKMAGKTPGGMKPEGHTAEQKVKEAVQAVIEEET